MAHKPKIIIINDLEKPLKADRAADRAAGGNSATYAQTIDEEFLSFLKEIATKVLPNSVSKAELLQEIQQILPSSHSSQQSGTQHPPIQ
jgi:hypothetical protein